MKLHLHVEPRWMSPYVFAVFVTLREKGLPFEATALDASRGATVTPGYLADTVTGRVPTLFHHASDGAPPFAIAESSAIVEYLEESFPEVPVLPRERQARARCRQLLSWLRSDDTAALREERPAATLFYGPDRRPLSEHGARAARKIVEVTGRLLRPSADHLFGAWSIADAELAFALRRLTANGDPVPSAVAAWVERQWQRPSVRAFADVSRPSSLRAPPTGR